MPEFSAIQLGYYLPDDVIHLALECDDIYTCMLYARVDVVLRFKFMYVSEMLAYAHMTYYELSELYNFAQDLLDFGA